MPGLMATMSTRGYNVVSPCVIRPSDSRSPFPHLCCFLPRYAASVFAEHLALSDRWSGLHQLRLLNAVHARFTASASASDPGSDQSQSATGDAAVTAFAAELTALSQRLIQHAAVVTANGTESGTGWRCALNAPAPLEGELRGLLAARFMRPILASSSSSVSAPSPVSSPSSPAVAAASRPRGRRTFVALPIPVHHVAMVLPSVGFYHADAPALALLASVLSDRFLHREIRERGGAYGGGAYQSNTDGVFGFMSYRDPNCARTIDAFRRAIDWICGDGANDATSSAAAEGPTGSASESSPSYPISQRELDEALLSVFADFDRPLAPSSVGGARFARGVDHADRERFRRRLLAVSIADVVAVAHRYLRGKVDAVASICVVGPAETPKTGADAAQFADWEVITLQ